MINEYLKEIERARQEIEKLARKEKQWFKEQTSIIRYMQSKNGQFMLNRINARIAEFNG